MKRIGTAVAVVLLLGACGSDPAPLIGHGPESSSGGKTGSGGSSPASNEAGGDPGAGGAAVPERTCVPGQSVACTGPGGCRGGQACAADGRSYEACACASSGAGGTRPGSGGQTSSGGVEEDAGAGSAHIVGQCAAGEVFYKTKCCKKNTCATGPWSDGIGSHGPLCGEIDDGCGGRMTCPSACPPGGECRSPSTACTCWVIELTSSDCVSGQSRYLCQVDQRNPIAPTIPGCIKDPFTSAGDGFFCCPTP